MNTQTQSTQQSTQQFVSRNMTLGDIVQKFPEAVDVIQERGLHCVGCGAAYWETLEEGAMGHGWTEDQLVEMVDAINMAVSESRKEGAHMKDEHGHGNIQENAGGCCGGGMEESVEEAMPEESMGGCCSGGGCGSSSGSKPMMPKSAQKITVDAKDVLKITPKAVEKAKEFMKAENVSGAGLRVAVIPGGCAGYSYELGFSEKPEANDMQTEESGLKIFIDADSVEYLKGTTLDFVETLHASGFKFSNPNAKSSCGCGTSFA